MRQRPYASGVAVAACATIALELLLTRISSVTMYYHFAFMVISVALLGLAVAGVAIFVGRRWFLAQAPGRLMAVFMILFALSTVLALRVISSNPIGLQSFTGDIKRFLTGQFLLLYLAAALPFVFSGFALSLAITVAGERIGRIYAFDLCGAAIGCVVVILALPALGGPGAVLAAAGLGAVAAVLFAWADSRPHRALSVAGAVVAVALVVLAWREGDARSFGLLRNPSKFVGQREVLFERWNALSQITVAPAGQPDHRWIFIDGDAATRMWAAGARADEWRATRRIPEVRTAALVYALRKQGPALIIGPGGGTDVISALRAGVPRVVGVEINPIIVDDVMKGAYADWTGRLYEDPRVRVVVDEGRSFIRHSEERYSSIQATLVDTWAASSSGAFALSENNIYTVEAFDEFLAHLQPGGILTFTRWYDPATPKEFLRLLAIGRAALARRGVAGAEQSQHFVVAVDRERRATMLLKTEPFTPEEIDTLRAEATAGALQLAFDPLAGGAPGHGLISGFLLASDPLAHLAGIPFDATPTTDDRPFFFLSLRRGQMLGMIGNLGDVGLNNLGVAILLFLLLLSVVLTLIFVLLPLGLFARGALAGQRPAKLRVLAYFLCLGLGFILLEIGLMQRFVLFLGHPIHALAVVLATLLATSGFGSALSGRGCARFGTRGYTRRVVLALAVVLGAYAVGLQPLFHALLGLPLAARVVVAVVLVAVLGLLLGAMLPTGVRVANSLGRDVVPWAWGLNGAASVVGSVLAVFTSLGWGFTVSLLVGLAVYLVAMLVLPVAPAGAAQSATGPGAAA